MRAPTKSPSMGGPQRCRHGEAAHLCPWCSYENGKQDGRAAMRARINAELRRLAAAADEVTDPQAAMIYEDFARWVETLAPVEAAPGGRPGVEV